LACLMKGVLLLLNLYYGQLSSKWLILGSQCKACSSLIQTEEI
jgi:hypothetical protein